MEIAEERERPRRSPFFAHEQHRDHRRQQRDRERGLDRPGIGHALEPVAERAVADLVVVLQEIDEGGRRKLAARLAAQLSAAMRGRLALIDKARAQRARDVLARRALIVAVVAVGFAGQQHVPGVMIIIVPLRAIFSPRRILVRIQQARGDCRRSRAPDGCGGRFPRRARRRATLRSCSIEVSPSSAIECTASSRSPSKR